MTILPSRNVIPGNRTVIPVNCYSGLILLLPDQLPPRLEFDRGLMPLERIGVSDPLANEQENYAAKSRSSRYRIRKQKRTELEAVCGKPVRVLQWDGPFPAKFMTEDMWQEQLEVDVQKGFDENLSKRQKRTHTITGEKKQQELAKQYQFTPTVHQLSCGAFIRLSDKLPYILQMYPGINEWRIQYDGAGGGVTQVVISPITRNTTSDLSPTNVWRLGLWRGKEVDCLEEYIKESHLCEDLSDFLQDNPDARCFK